MENLKNYLVELNNKFLEINSFEVVKKGKSLYLISDVEKVKLKIKINTSKFLENMINIKLNSELILESKLAEKIKKSIIEYNLEENIEEIIDAKNKLLKLLKATEIFYKGKGKEEFLIQELYNLFENKNKILIKKFELNNNKIIINTTNETLEFEIKNNIKTLTHSDTINIKTLKYILDILLKNNFL